MSSGSVSSGSTRLQERKAYENNEPYVGKVGLVHVEDCDTRKDPVCYGKFSQL